MTTLECMTSDTFRFHMIARYSAYQILDALDLFWIGETYSRIRIETGNGSGDGRTTLLAQRLYGPSSNRGCGFGGRSGNGKSYG
jgi:hypothetical protein